MAFFLTNHQESNQQATMTHNFDSYLLHWSKKRLKKKNLSKKCRSRVYINVWSSDCYHLLQADRNENVNKTFDAMPNAYNIQCIEISVTVEHSPVQINKSYIQPHKTHSGDENIINWGVCAKKKNK